MRRKKYSDLEILDGIRNNNNGILVYIYEKDFPSLLNHITDTGGDEFEAEDVFHDALLVIFKKVRSESFVLTSSFHTYIQAVARLIWKKRLDRSIYKRKSIGKLEEELLLDDPEYDNEFEEIERRKLYKKLFEELPTDCQKLMTYIIEGNSLTQVTKLMKYNSIEYTKTKRVRCKERLMTKIFNHPLFKELKNERFGKSDSIPRW